MMEAAAKRQTRHRDTLSTAAAPRCLVPERRGRVSLRVRATPATPRGGRLGQRLGIDRKRRRRAGGHPKARRHLRITPLDAWSVHPPPAVQDACRYLLTVRRRRVESQIDPTKLNRAASAGLLGCATAILSASWRIPSKSSCSQNTRTTGAHRRIDGSRQASTAGNGGFEPTGGRSQLSGAVAERNR